MGTTFMPHVSSANGIPRTLDFMLNLVRHGQVG